MILNVFESVKKFQLDINPAIFNKKFHNYIKNNCLKDCMKIQDVDKDTYCDIVKEIKETDNQPEETDFDEQNTADIIKNINMDKNDNITKIVKQNHTKTQNKINVTIQENETTIQPKKMSTETDVFHTQKVTENLKFNKNNNITKTDKQSNIKSQTKINITIQENEAKVQQEIMSTKPDVFHKQNITENLEISTKNTKAVFLDKNNVTENPTTTVDFKTITKIKFIRNDDKIKEIQNNTQKLPDVMNLLRRNRKENCAFSFNPNIFLLMIIVLHF